MRLETLKYKKWFLSVSHVLHVRPHNRQLAQRAAHSAYFDLVIIQSDSQNSVSERKDRKTKRSVFLRRYDNVSIFDRRKPRKSKGKYGRSNQRRDRYVSRIKKQKYNSLRYDSDDYIPIWNWNQNFWSEAKIEASTKTTARIISNCFAFNQRRERLIFLHALSL